jgi:hypothetical protein
MRRWELALVCLVALGLGALAGGFAPPTEAPSARRPGGVENALRALDQFERGGALPALAAASAAAGPASNRPSPWREEIELVAVVATGDDDALWRFSTATPPGPARARGLRILVRTAKTSERRAAAAQRLAADYPESWAAGRAGGGR